MTYEQAVRNFKEMAHDLYERKVDYWTAEQAWAAYVDGLCKDGEITQRQYDRWPTPFKYGRHLKRGRSVIRYSNNSRA